LTLKVGIDLTALLPQPTGVDRYMTELVAALVRARSDERFTLFVNRADRERFTGLPSDVGICAVGLRPRPARLLVQQAVLPALCASCGIDVLHSPSFLIPWIPARARHVLTVHDMTFFSMPHVHTRLRRSGAFRRMVLASIRRASLINVPARVVRDELLSQVPGVDAARVRVTPYGVASRFCADSSGDETRLAQLPWLPPAPFVLSVCTLEPRKNLPVLIEAFRRLAHGGRDLHLVLAGRLGDARMAVDAAIAASGLGDRIHVPGFIHEDVLPALYRRARVFAHPSLAEGFGFPPLEAMACGVPVVASSNSSLAENLDGAAVMVDSDDSRALAAAIHTLASDEAARAHAISAGLDRAARFTWDETARMTLDGYREIGRGARSWRRPAVSPFRRTL
jgi:glycosyltransferase involved in cell wall biosynthesis